MTICVVLHNGDDFLRLVLNWRMGYDGGRVYENVAVNNVLRVHGWNSNEVYTSTVNTVGIIITYKKYLPFRQPAVRRIVRLNATFVKWK